MVWIPTLIFAQVEQKFIILNFLGKEGLGEGRAQDGLSGCWRGKCAEVLLYAQALDSRYSLGWGQQSEKVSVDLSVTPEITFQVAGIFMLIFLFLSLPEPKGWLSGNVKDQTQPVLPSFWQVPWCRALQVGRAVVREGSGRKKECFLKCLSPGSLDQNPNFQVKKPLAVCLNMVFFFYRNC